MKFLEKKTGFLTFTGAPGIGKTYLCSCLIGWAANEFNSIRYWNERQLLQRIREGMDLRGDFLESLKLLIDDDFLIIDDLGSSGINEWRTGVLFDAVDYRYESLKSTVVTSNFDQIEISRLFGPRFASRIFAAENIVISLHGGQDLRKYGL